MFSCLLVSMVVHISYIHIYILYIYIHIAIHINRYIHVCVYRIYICIYTQSCTKALAFCSALG